MPWRAFIGTNSLDVICAILEILLAVAFAFHCFTSLLWLYEKRRRGMPEARGVRPHAVVAWVGEGFALSLTIVAWPFGFLPGRRIQSTAHPNRPVVLVHGWGMNRSSMFLLASRLKRDGRQAYSINYGSLATSTDDKAREVAQKLRAILRESGSGRIDLVAHSLGGVVLRAIAKDYGGLEFFGNVVTLGSPHRGTALAVLFRRFGLFELRPGSRYLARLAEEDPIAGRSVNFTAIYSGFDFIVFPTDCTFYPPAFNAEIDDVGHMGMLVSDRVYAVVKENLDAEPVA